MAAKLDRKNFQVLTEGSFSAEWDEEMNELNGWQLRAIRKVRTERVGQLNAWKRSNDLRKGGEDENSLCVYTNEITTENVLRVCVGNRLRRHRLEIGTSPAPRQQIAVCAVGKGQCRARRKRL